MRTLHFVYIFFFAIHMEDWQPGLSHMLLFVDPLWNQTSLQLLKNVTNQVEMKVVVAKEIPIQKR